MVQGLISEIIGGEVSEIMGGGVKVLSEIACILIFFILLDFVWFSILYF